MRAITSRGRPVGLAAAASRGSPAGDAAIHLDDVSRIYHDGRGDEATVAVDRVSLRVAPGEIVMVMGRSGSGKSTLLNICGLLDRPSSGSVRLGGAEVDHATEKERNHLRAQRIGFVFQRHHLFEHRRAIDSVTLPLLHLRRRVGREELRDRALGALDAVGMGWSADRIAATLSGGERQRVAVARAMVTSPTLLLCDEPTGQLDSANAERVITAICRTAQLGTAVVVVTHDRGAAPFGDRVLEMVDGRFACS